MNIIDKYFNKMTKDLAFIELKENTNVKVDNFIIEDIPLPIITDHLINEAKSGNLEKQIDLKDIIDGIIYLLGADKDFRYKNDYLDLLLAYNENIVDYLLHQASSYMGQGKYDISCLHLRSLLLIDPHNIDGLFNYGIGLEEIGMQLLDKGKDEARDFIRESTNQFETILDIDDAYDLSYYKLGFHYRYFERYMKAGLIWNKFLTLSKDDLLMQEIREELELIKDDIYFETGFTYLNFKDYDKALDAFLKLLPAHKESWNVNLLIGQTYSALGQYEDAIAYIENAIEFNKEEADIYNELGILYYNMGNINKAVEVFTNGIENSSEDYKLLFNRGLGYLELGLYDLSLKDIDKAYSLNPEDTNIKEQRSKLMDLLQQYDS